MPAPLTALDDSVHHGPLPVNAGDLRDGQKEGLLQGALGGGHCLVKGFQEAQDGLAPELRVLPLEGAQRRAPDDRQVIPGEPGRGVQKGSAGLCVCSKANG
jgi:hypothetical protein